MTACTQLSATSCSSSDCTLYSRAITSPKSDLLREAHTQAPRACIPRRSLKDNDQRAANRCNENNDDKQTIKQTCARKGLSEMLWFVASMSPCFPSMTHRDPRSSRSEPILAPRETRSSLA